LDCQQIDDYIWAYCDGTLSPELTVELDEHLNNCHYCRKMVDLCRMETEILAAAPDIPPLNDDFSRRVIISLNPSTVPSAPRGGLFSFLGRHRYGLGGAVAAAVLLLALYLPGMMEPKQFEDTAELPIKSESAQIADNQLPLSPNGENDEYGNKLMMGKEVPQAESSPDMDYSVSGSEPDHQGSSDELLIAMRSLNNDAKEIGTQALNAVEKSRNKDALSRHVDPHSPVSASTIDDTTIVMNEEESKLDLLALHPRNIPSEYQLEKIVNASSKAVSYYYLNPDNNESLEITIAISDSMELEKQESNLAGLDGVVETEDNVPHDILLNSTKTSISYQDHLISIMLKAKMPMEQLEDLTKSISFE
jgi:hypothetical protein